MRTVSFDNHKINHLTSQGYHTLADQKMLHQALLKGWNITEKVKDDALTAIQDVLNITALKECHRRGFASEDDSKLIALKMMAVKNLALLDSLNIKRISILMPKNVVHHKAENLSDEELNKAILETAGNLGLRMEPIEVEPISETLKERVA